MDPNDLLVRCWQWFQDPPENREDEQRVLNQLLDDLGLYLAENGLLP